MGWFRIGPPRTPRSGRRGAPARLGLAVLLIVGLVAGDAAVLHPAPRRAQAVWAVQLPWEDGGQAWPESVFAKLAAQGVNAAEINLEWTWIEPRPGDFSFTVLDQDLANAAAGGVQLIPIFWQSVWSGNPASWIRSHDITSTGAKAAIPSWWNAADQAAYFTYVTQTIRHIRTEPGFGGAFLDYGWLDAMWGQVPDGTSGISGYSADDIGRFHQWLPGQYRSLAAFNSRWKTRFTSWGAVPAALPGQALFPVYQAFRDWSVQDTYARLTAAVRRETDAPLYYYWGGDLSQAGQFFNIPDTFFALARRYGVTVVLDDAENPGLGLLFGSLARAYHVPLLQEWTPSGSGTQLTAEAAQWLAQIGLGRPNAAGEDFFLYNGGQEFDVGFPLYLNWRQPLLAAGGAYPQQPAAVYLSYAQAMENPQALASVSGSLAALWRQAPSAFAVVTDREVAARAAHLSAYRAVLSLTGQDATVRAYEAGGGHLVTDAAQLRAVAPPYATFDAPASPVEVVPSVDAAGRRAWLAVANTSAIWPYAGTVTLHYAGLGLGAGPFHLIDGATGQAVAAQAVSGGLAVPLSLATGALTAWELLPGAGPAGGGAVPKGSSAGAAPGGHSVTATAGRAGQGLAILEVGGTAQGSDGNLDLVQRDGQAAVATWTTARSGTGGAYLYLQLNPSGPVHAATHVSVTVTYLATPGQGFSVQYDGGRGPYENGPAVIGPGTGTWATATVQLTDARFDEGQNATADLRLAASDGSQPLVVRSVVIAAEP